MSRRDDIWPEHKDHAWPQEAGWFKGPRILPVALLIADHVVGSGKDLTRTYLDLLARNWDEGFLDVTDERESAFLAGFKTERGRRTWSEHVGRLAELGFIKVEPVGPRKVGSILLLDPLRALYQLRADGKVPNALWQLLLKRCDEFSISLLDESAFRPQEARDKKKKHGPRAEQTL